MGLSLNSPAASPAHRRKWGLILTLGAALLVTAVTWYATRPKPVAVSLQKVDRGQVEASVANTRAGTIEACQRARIAPPIGGQVAQLPVNEGDHVRTGQVLLSLWNDDLKAEIKLTEKEASAAKARAQETCSLANVTKREAQRLLKLRKSGLVSEDRVDRAVTDAKAREAACRASRATAEVSTARIAVTHAKLERTILTAPFDGVVAEVNAKLGEYVTPSPPGVPMPPAVDLISEGCLYVTAPIDEVDAAVIRPGQTARITLDAFSGRHFRGQVRRVAPYVLDREKQARTVEVETAFVDPKDTENLLPGYSADIEVIIDSRSDTLRVPTEAVLEGHRILVYNPARERLEERQFKPGLANWKFTEVVEGVELGELIVVSVEREGVAPGAYVIPEERANKTDSRR